MRGGSWNNKPARARSANRNKNTPDRRNNNLGFRPASLPAVQSARVHGFGQRNTRVSMRGLPCLAGKGALNKLSGGQVPGLVGSPNVLAPFFILVLFWFRRSARNLFFGALRFLLWFRRSARNLLFGAPRFSLWFRRSARNLF
ncbi:MAG: hypothetical protein GY862_06310, partial [Gammaproteobacteria bacterium]|nr:hypothetical protein [Gammaproteobacteria bacterium]